MTEAQYPGLNHGRNATYSEGLFFGYRWYDRAGVTPRFPFGHGLSYTRFEYAALAVAPDASAVSFRVRNAGAVAGAEVAQLYVAFPAAAGEPLLQLRGFQKARARALSVCRVGQWGPSLSSA